MNDAAVEGAIAFTDLVGFTEYTATQGDQEALAVLGAQERIVRDALPASARVVKELGDGLLIFFTDATTAIPGCLAILDGFDRAADAEEMPLWVRAGLHWGRPSSRGDDLIGHDVNVAARVAASAAGDQVLATVAVRDAVGQLRGVHFGRARRRTFKGVGESVSVVPVERA